MENPLKAEGKSEKKFKKHTGDCRKRGFVKCVCHKEKDAVVMCSVCGTGLCSECDIKLVGRYYCQNCADEIVKEGTIVTLRKMYAILEEKRKNHRIYSLVQVEIALSCSEGKSLKGTMHNISCGGMAILCDEQISVNEIVYLSFVLPNGQKMENIQAGVVRVKKIGEKYNVGALFMNMLEKQKPIDDFIYDAKRNRYIGGNVDLANYHL